MHHRLAGHCLEGAWYNSNRAKPNMKNRQISNRYTFFEAHLKEVNNKKHD
jgi:hypothetical protein